MSDLIKEILKVPIINMFIELQRSMLKSRITIIRQYQQRQNNVKKSQSEILQLESLKTEIKVTGEAQKYIWTDKRKNQ